MPRFLAVLTLAAVLAGPWRLPAAADQPQWGDRFTRNMASAETDLPATFEPGRRDPGTGDIVLPERSGVRWVARLGSQTCGSPIVAGGRVFVGTNNGQPRDPRIQGDRNVLMCFDEQTGEFLWQLAVPKFEEVRWADWRGIGFVSPPTVEGDRAYAVTGACQVVALDVHGMANGNQGPFTDEAQYIVPPGRPPLEPTEQCGDIVWLYDMYRELGVEPHNASNGSILLDGNLLYVPTSNGVEWTHSYVVNPDAPTLIVLDKRDGKLLARDDFGVGPDVTHGQWSSPAMGVVDGRKLVFYGAGDGFLYAARALDEERLPADDELPVLLENVLKFNGEPRAQTEDHVPRDHRHDSLSYQVTAMPVVHEDRVYCVFTQEAFHNKKEGWLVCIDATRTGDITRTGIVWAYDGLGSSVSTPAIADGLLYVADFFGRMHCLDAETGEVQWVHPIDRPVWGSPLAADGKVYLGTGRETLWVFRAGRELEVLERIRMHDAIHTTPTAANGTLFIATGRHLYAVDGVE